MPFKYNKTVTKRKNKKGKFLFYSLRTKKRISKQSYYSRLKLYHTRVKNQKQKIETTRLSSDIKRRPVRLKYAQGFDYITETNLTDDNPGREEIINQIDDIFLETTKRYKAFKDRTVVFIRLIGKIFLSNGDELEFYRATDNSYFDQYKEQVFRLGQITAAVDHYIDYKGDSKYKADGFLISQVVISRRGAEDTTKKPKRRKA